VALLIKNRKLLFLAITSPSEVRDILTNTPLENP